MTEVGKKSMCSFTKNENVSFDNELDIYRSFDIYEENGYKHILGLSVISQYLHVSHPARSECKAESVRFKALLPYHEGDENK